MVGRILLHYYSMLLTHFTEFTFTKDGSDAHSSKLAGEPFYYQEMSQTPHTQDRSSCPDRKIPRRFGPALRNCDPHSAFREWEPRFW